MKRFHLILGCSFLAALCMFVSCGKPQYEEGSIRIQVGAAVLLSKSLETIDNLQCVLYKSTDEVYDQEHVRAGSGFIIDIEELEPGGDYSVFLYGENVIGEVIGLCSEDSILVTEGDVTDVQLTWRRFNPVLVSPANGSTMSENTPMFDWGDVPGSFEYEIEVDNSSSFTSPEIAQSGLTSSSYTPAAPLSNGIYHWRVRSRDGQEGWSGWSVVWSLNIVTNFITITTPNGGDTWYVGENQDVVWTSSKTSGNVRIEYSTNGGSEWITVIGITPDDQIHPWKIPDTPSTNCYIKITDYLGNPKDQSNDAFTISSEKGTVRDIDGNIYQTIKIGNQWWMAENLKVSRYRNGDLIPDVMDDTDWVGLTIGARCAYDNDQSNVKTYGYLYNWHAVNDDRNIAPVGWHVPTDAEWQILFARVGGSGSQLKEAGSVHWISSGVPGTNWSGFTALPGGYRGSLARFSNPGFYADFWSASEYSLYGASRVELTAGSSGIDYKPGSKRFGSSVRCIRD